MQSILLLLSCAWCIFFFIFFFIALSVVVMCGYSCAVSHLHLEIWIYLHFFHQINRKNLNSKYDEMNHSLSANIEIKLRVSIEEKQKKNKKCTKEYLCATITHIDGCERTIEWMSDWVSARAHTVLCFTASDQWTDDIENSDFFFSIKIHRKFCKLRYLWHSLIE